jgi:hypothetical protein
VYSVDILFELVAVLISHIYFHYTRERASFGTPLFDCSTPSDRSLQLLLRALILDRCNLMSNFILKFANLSWIANYAVCSVKLMYEVSDVLTDLT